jgi:hypothetical protein
VCVCGVCSPACTGEPTRDRDTKVSAGQFPIPWFALFDLTDGSEEGFKPGAESGNWRIRGGLCAAELSAMLSCSGTASYELVLSTVDWPPGINSHLFQPDIFATAVAKRCPNKRHKPKWSAILGSWKRWIGPNPDRWQSAQDSQCGAGPIHHAAAIIGKRLVPASGRNRR